MKIFILFTLSILTTATYTSAQIYPISLKERVEKSTTIAIVTVNEKYAYWDDNMANIYTLNILEVEAYLKGHSTHSEIAMITEGGVVDNNAQKSYPETKVNLEMRYIVFLDEENYIVDDKNYRSAHPNTAQCLAIARVQGAMLFQDGKYYDALSEAPQTEEELLDKIQNLLREKAKKPDGKIYQTIAHTSGQNSINRNAFTITSIEDGFGTMAPGPFIGGTIVTGNELIIKASGGGFGASRGSGKVEFDSADDGGATMIEPPNASDYVSWSDTEIRVKIPSDAGTGDVKVTDGGGATDTYSSITIKWAMNAVDSDFHLWGAANRNRVELVEDNGAGGYTMEYSSVGGMSTNTDAKAAFERALSTWRCATFINIDVSPTATGVGFADDGTNVVMFASLSGSTLGVATSRYSANGTGSCDMEDTFWRLNELDIRFDDSGTTWYYGSGACTGSKYDFESVAVHELGHGHGLGHINDAAKVMNFSISTCVIIHDPHADEVEAGDHKMDHSEMANCLGPPIYPDVITPVPPGSCSLLPVELTYFKGKDFEGQVILNWGTATEVNNDYFLIKKSLDGRNFEDLGMVQGHGNSFESQNYELIDERPAIGMNYYRLSQFDFDGVYEVFDKIVAVEYYSENGIAAQPNPVKGNQVQLIYQTNIEGGIKVDIYNVTGQLVQQLDLRTTAPRNVFEISLDNLSNGVYIIQTAQQNNFQSLRFVKTD